MCYSICIGFLSVCDWNSYGAQLWLHKWFGQ